MADFPAFDLAAHEALSGPTRAESAAQLKQICRGTGFQVQRGHGVGNDVIAAVWSLMPLDGNRILRFGCRFRIPAG